MTRSCTCFHFAAAAGAEASLQRITSARLSGTPAASRLESRRVKFSSIRAETLLEPPKESLGLAPFAFSAAASFTVGFAGLFGRAFAGALATAFAGLFA